MGSPGAIAALAAAAALCAASQAGAVGSGAALYDANCALCHQRGGTGLRGQFPRLAGRVAGIGRTPKGRSYLLQVILNGMAGQVSVDGEKIVGVMPSFRMLSDEQIAAILSYVMALPGGVAPAESSIRVQQVAAVRRAAAVSPNAMSERRAVLLKTQPGR